MHLARSAVAAGTGALPMQSQCPAGRALAARRRRRYTRGMIEGLRIVGLCVAAAVAYGLAHDQVTARVCVEYFSVFHPPVIASDDPTALALVWGVIATWWMGVLLGVPLAAIARAGAPPRLTARDLRRPIGRLLLVMGVLALLAGIIGYLGGTAGWFRPPIVVRDALPPARHARFLADAFAHQTSYAVGFFGGLVVWLWAYRERGRRRVDDKPFKDPTGLDLS
jgi:hypothetical protein